MPIVTMSWSKGDDAAPDLPRDDLRDVHRRHERGRPDAQPEHEAGEDERPDVLGERRPDRASDEGRTGQDRRPPAADPVGQVAGPDHAHDGADEERADDRLLFEARRLQVFLDEEEGASDDSRVVAEEKAADRRYEGDADEGAVAALQCLAQELRRPPLRSVVRSVPAASGREPAVTSGGGGGRGRAR
jgi:hypothetical protein